LILVLMILQMLMRWQRFFAGGPSKLTILGGPLLSIWEVARSQLEHVSFGLLDGLANDYDDHDEDGQQNEDAADGHGHHGAVTHAGTVGSLSGSLSEWNRCRSLSVFFLFGRE